MRLLVDNLTVSYRHRPAVHHVCCTFEAGSMWALCGPNGAGKSTLLKSMMRLIKPDTGSIRWQGVSRRDIAYLPQQSDIDRSQPMNVFELAATGLWYEIGFFRGIGASGRKRIDNALARVGMDNFAQHPIGSLSNGQFQRVLFARMLVQNARFLLLDEPFNAVDENTTRILLDLLQHCHREEGRSIIAVLHDYEQVRRHFDQTLLIAREKIAAGTSTQVLCPANLEAAATAMRRGESMQWCALNPSDTHQAT